MLLGSGVCSLFPSLTKTRTAKIVRKQAGKIPIKWENIDYRWLTLYIRMNRDLSSGVEKVAHLLPNKRPGKRGREPGMSSTECMRRFLEDEFKVNGKWMKSSWIWPTLAPTEQELNELMAIMLEISVAFFFDNFVYTFGGKNYVQSSGGPIGARVTMCISRLIMQDWWEEFIEILKVSEIDWLMGAIYVDDGRIIIEKLQKGIRFCEDSKVFKFKSEWLEQDIKSNKTDTENTEFEVRKAMNSISPDLIFTTEKETDFNNKRLPTLSFQMWSEQTGIRHSYYEKDMRSQILTMKLSSQSEQSKFNILVNELTRRFEVLDMNITIEEKTDIIDHYTQQLVNSGYGYMQIKEIIESSLKGIVRKEEKRKLSLKRFRSAEETLQERNLRKLTENTTWFRERENEENEENILKLKVQKGAWTGWRKNNGKRKRKDKNEVEIEGKKKIMSVIFVAHTEKSEMAKRLREKLAALEKLGNLKFKIVEKTGNKLENILHKSNAWGDLDCCSCCSESAGENEKRGQCKK